MYVIIVIIVCSLPFLPLFFLSNNFIIAVLCALVPTMNGAAYLAPSYAMVQSLVPLRMRAQAAAILLFTLNIIGFGLGPLLVGWESDLLRPAFGDDSIRWAMLSTAATWIIAGWSFWMASRTLKNDLAAGAGPKAPLQVEVAV
jgi:MFS transporter, Spinster family, sphingosine-1-phosphate transporter